MTATATTSKTDELLHRLSEGVQQLTSSDEWVRYLDVQRRFHNYSWGNCLLIALQRGDSTNVAGFRTWLQLGRHVRKGEKGIAILAPLVRRSKVEDPATGDEVTLVSEPHGFRVVHVFDISQTDGDPLPEAPCRRLTGDDPGEAFERLEYVALRIGYSVDFAEMPDERNGDCTYADHSIRIRKGLSPAQSVKTLCHEIGHALMHSGATATRDQIECEAESVAYVVCADLGLDTSQYSFGYLAGWAGDGDKAAKTLAESAARIRFAANTILEALDAQTLAA